jgi:ubiquinone biosynthesis protein COQ9
MTDNTLPKDPTLDEIRDVLASRLGNHAGFDGWNARSVAAAADELAIEPDLAQLATKGRAIDLIDLWISYVDAEMARRLPDEKLSAIKIRQRITALVVTRLEIMALDREALRRALTIMAMPQNLASAARLGWRSADRMWRLAGDNATDFNHYTKRLTLSAVYASVLAVFVNDESDDFAETRKFLDRRIENIMQFEKAKAGVAARRENFPSPSRLIGRLRYPAR